MTPEQLATFLGYFSAALGTAEVLAPGGLGRTLGLDQQQTLLRVYGLRELGAGAGLLVARNPRPWVWARIGGDALDIVTLIGALKKDNPRRGAAGVALAMVLGITALDVLCAAQLRK